eukprot:gene18020-12920_t
MVERKARREEDGLWNTQRSPAQQKRSARNDRSMKKKLTSSVTAT